MAIKHFITFVGKALCRLRWDENQSLARYRHHNLTIITPKCNENIPILLDICVTNLLAHLPSGKLNGYAKMNMILKLYADQWGQPLTRSNSINQNRRQSDFGKGDAQRDVLIKYMFTFSQFSNCISHARLGNSVPTPFRYPLLKEIMYGSGCSWDLDMVLFWRIFLVCAWKLEEIYLIFKLHSPFNCIRSCFVSCYKKAKSYVCRLERNLTI